MSNLFTSSNYYNSGTYRIVKITESKVILDMEHISVCPCCGKVVSTSHKTKSIPKAEYDAKMKRIQEFLEDF